MTIKYAKLIIDNRATQLDRLFTYTIKEDFIDIIQEGMRVIIPFGRGNKIIQGLVVSVVDHINAEYKLKEIIDLLDNKPIISKELIELSLWMKEEYLSTYLSAFQPVLPPGDYKKVNSFVKLVGKGTGNHSLEEKTIIEYLTQKDTVLLESLKKDLQISNINKYLNKLEDNELIEISIDISTEIKKKKEKRVRILEGLDLEDIEKLVNKRYHRQREIAQFLLEKKDISLYNLISQLGTTLNTIKNLKDKGVLTIYEREIHREPIKKIIPQYKKHKLNPIQEEAFNNISKEIDKIEGKDKFLLHGVTGSGKTEIYLQLVEKMLKLGKDSIVLVPEISLTPQTIDRFVGRFGNSVAILHSRLSQGERFDQWRKIKEGKVNIVVGARSAIFAPFANLGLIVIDEEHESTYKSSQNPKYDTIEVASKRTQLESATLVLGTATPSINTYHKAKTGEFELLELRDRIKKRPMPKISLVDMREELKSGNTSIFSRQLHEEITNTIDNDKQVILFLNRRGFSTFVTCRECGYVATCENCDISMTYYRNINKLRCHYCGMTRDIPLICPVCKSKYIKYFGIGTEKVEELTKELFPSARIVRMDSDTVGDKDSYDRTFEAMKNKEIDILIGTQMISKGLDFTDVNLVGIIAADTTLNLPDYRSPERTFQLITQVAGRSGRGDELGKVILQTYDPGHYSIQYAKNQEYTKFYDAELPLRQEFLYPPFINLINILVFGENQYKVCKLTKNIYNIIIEYIYEFYGKPYINHIIGPNPAPLEKIKNNYRWQIIAKIEDNYLKEFKTLLRRIFMDNEFNLDRDRVKFSIDINPNSIL